MSALLLACALAHPAPPATGIEPAATDRAALEKKFADLLTGAKLVGSYTTGAGAAPKEEEYEIASAAKGDGGTWVISAKIGYSGSDVVIPVPVEVKWAGDTPVITLDDLTIPGMGTFGARVLFHDGRYAGTWSHGEKGGHLFGAVERAGE